MDYMVPIITDPLGLSWKQPPRTAITIRGEYATMKKIYFNQLLEYSSSFPSAVYVGKMWKCRGPDSWLLRWYDAHPTNPSLCTIEQRHIIIQELVDLITTQ